MYRGKQTALVARLPVCWCLLNHAATRMDPRNKPKTPCRLSQLHVIRDKAITNTATTTTTTQKQISDRSPQNPFLLTAQSVANQLLTSQSLTRTHHAHGTAWVDHARHVNASPRHAATLGGEGVGLELGRRRGAHSPNPKIFTKTFTTINPINFFTLYLLRQQPYNAATSRRMGIGKQDGYIHIHKKLGVQSPAVLEQDV